MKQLSYLFLFLLPVMQSCKVKTTPKQEIYNEDFKWTITIPENFEAVKEAEQERLKKKGIDAMEQTVNGEVVNMAKGIFMFKNDKFNYFESNYQALDAEELSDYPATCETIENVMYETFKTQMKDVKIDTSKTFETIDGLEFRVFKVRLAYPNALVLNVRMFSRLFSKRDFSVIISYTDEAKGALMLDAWRKSKFGK